MYRKAVHGAQERLREPNDNRHTVPREHIFPPQASLESELVKEIRHAGGLLVALRRLRLVLLLKQLLHGLSGIVDGGLGNGGLVHNLLEVNIDGVSGGHQVVEVQHLHERLYFASLLQLSLAHRSHDLARVSVDTGNCD